MNKVTMILLTVVFGFTASANAVCTAHVTPPKPLERTPREIEIYETLVKIVKKRGWTLSRYQNTADVTVTGSCQGDLGNMLAEIDITDNRTKESINMSGTDLGFFIEGECAPALKDAAARDFPICEN